MFELGGPRHMSTQYSLTLLLRRIDQVVDTFTSFPIFLSLDEAQQLVITDIPPANGLFNYCIEIDIRTDSLMIRPQDAHFDLYLHRQKGDVIHVLRPFALEKGDSLGIDEIDGPEWDLLIEQKANSAPLCLCPSCREFYVQSEEYCPHCGYKNTSNQATDGENTNPYMRQKNDRKPHPMGPEDDLEPSQTLYGLPPIAIANSPSLTKNEQPEMIMAPMYGAPPPEIERQPERPRNNKILWIAVVIALLIGVFLLSSG